MYINFWTPGSTSFKVLEAGELFLFKLHNKKNSGVNGEVAGGGYFSHFERLNMADAWKKYGIGNGAATINRESLNTAYTIGMYSFGIGAVGSIIWGIVRKNNARHRLDRFYFNNGFTYTF